MNAAGARGRTVGRLDGSLAVLVGVLLVVSVVAWLGPSAPAFSDARALDIAINVAATLVGAAVAILAWVRWRETREAVALYQSSAFVALTMTNALMMGLVIAGLEVEFGLSPEAPGEAPVYLWTLARFAAATLLVIGAVRSLRRHRPPLPPLVIALVPMVVLVVVALVLFGREAALPPVPNPGPMDPIGAVARSPASAVIAAVQVLIFGAFLLAAVLLRRLYVRDGLVSNAFLAAGLVVAAFSQLHFGLEPVVAVGVVTTSDALRLVFYGILFMGIQAELAADLGALRRANDELRRLAEVDTANALLAERTRLAREIHDGLAQDLWYAKLKQGRLAADASLGEDARTTVREVLTALDSALAEARQAVMAMRVDPGSGTLGEVLRSYVDDFADRFGIRAEYQTDGVLERLPPRTEAEVLRIVQEALNNVRRHADATVVRVTSEHLDGRIRLMVIDNGRGFDPGVVGDHSYGLRGMRERADLVGARLEIDSRPSDGTRVSLEVPVAEGPRSEAPR